MSTSYNNNPYGQPSASPYQQPSATPYQDPSAGGYAQPGYASAEPYSAQDPYAQYPAYGAGAEVSPYTPPAQPYGYGMAQQDHPQATTVFVLGLLSMILFPLLGPFAIVMGNKAKKEVAANPGTYRSGGLLTVGWVLGIVGTVFLGLAILYVIFLVIVFASIR